MEMPSSIAMHTFLDRETDMPRLRGAVRNYQTGGYCRFLRHVSYLLMYLVSTTNHHE